MATDVVPTDVVVATAYLIGPYYQAGPLPPQNEQVWALGPFPAAFSGTMHVMAHPWVGPGAEYTQALAVTFVQMVVDPFGRHAVNFIVKNTSVTIVAAYTVWLSTIQA